MGQVSFQWLVWTRKKKKTHHIILSLRHPPQILEATTRRHWAMPGKRKHPGPQSPSSASDDGSICSIMGGRSDSDADVRQVSLKRSVKSKQPHKSHYKKKKCWSSPDARSDAQSRPTAPSSSRQTSTIPTEGPDGPVRTSDDMALPSGISRQSSQRLVGAHDVWAIFEKGDIKKDLPNVCKLCK